MYKRQADNYQELSCFHDASDAHGIGLTRNIVFRSEETLVGIDGAFRQIHTLGAAGECVRRLIEADMSIVAKAQKLQVDTAGIFDDVVIIAAGFGSVRFQSVRHIGAGLVDIYMVKKIGVHKIPVALVVVSA